MGGQRRSSPRSVTFASCPSTGAAALLLCCCAAALLAAAPRAGAEDPYRFFTWNVTYGDIWPLGVKQQGILINGQFPGPQIEAVTNDNLIINVINSLTEPFLLSWSISMPYLLHPLSPSRPLISSSSTLLALYSCSWFFSRSFIWLISLIWYLKYLFFSPIFSHPVIG